MKHIKLYESVNKKFWKVKTSEPDFTISLQKLGFSNDDINKFHNKVNYENIKKQEYVYIFNHKSPGKLAGDWVYSTTLLTDDDFTFMGGIEINPEDIEKWKYNNTINKYNL